MKLKEDKKKLDEDHKAAIKVYVKEQERQNNDILKFKSMLEKAETQLQ